MKKKIYDILSGKLLIDKDAAKNWKFILFCTLLAMIMIAFSHNAERKVHTIAKLEKNVHKLRSEFIDQREQLMRLKMKTSVSQRLENRGISISHERPYKIVVE